MAQPATTWDAGPTALSHPVHLALLPTGKVLYVAGSGFHRPSIAGPYKAGLWDPATNDQKEYLLEEDIWCSGHAVLPNGNVLFVGGTLKYPQQSPNHRWWGLDAVYEFDFAAESFQSRPRMSHGRWYPTVVLLDSGKVQVVEGYDEYGYNNSLNEIYDPVTQTWSISYNPNTGKRYCAGCSGTSCAAIPGAGTSCYGGPGQGVNPFMGLYPRMHLLPSGLIAFIGQPPARYLWDPATGKWYPAGKGTHRSYGTSVLLPLQNSGTETGKILTCGGSEPGYPAIAKNTAEITEQSNLQLVSRTIQSMSYARRYCNPVILPDGKVLIVGGTESNNDKTLAVFTPELFDPVTQTWTILSAHSTPRIYHSGALLLTDGRILLAGSSYSPYDYELSTEIFSPSYVHEDRPSIIEVSSVATYGGVINIVSPEAEEIGSVSLIRMSSTTHHYNTDQRLIWLEIIDRVEFSIAASAPINSKLAPPGYYLLHVLDGAGIPSKGIVVQIL